MYLKIIISLFLVSVLTACSGNIQNSTPDEIFDAIDGMTNHANEPDSDL